MKKIAHSADQLIGHTPLLKCNRLVDDSIADLYLKLEMFNVGGSIKDRIALNMIEEAEKEGLIKPGDTLIEATSGNTGVGLAMIGAIKGYDVVIVLNENASIERRRIIQAYGGQLKLVPEDWGMDDSVNYAQELVDEKGWHMVSQLSNPANPAIHKKTTGPEILEAFGGQAPDAFVAGIGTGGTITGVGQVLKKARPETKIIAVEPAESPVLAGGERNSHGIQGIGNGLFPEVLDQSIYDDILHPTTEEAYKMVRRVAQSEGVFLGISSGAAIHAGIEVAKNLGPGYSVVVLCADTGERYLSTGITNPETDESLKN